MDNELRSAFCRCYASILALEHGGADASVAELLVRGFEGRLLRGVCYHVGCAGVVGAGPTGCCPGNMSAQKSIQPRPHS